MVGLLLYLSIAIFFSFLCSILEAVLLSVTPSFLSIKKEEGKKFAIQLEGLKQNIDRPLAAILTLNTFAHTIGAAGVGAQAQKLWGDEYLSIVSAVLTLLILILSEIIPKTLGANYWKQLAPFTAKALKILIYSPLYPFILLAQAITRVFGKGEQGSVLSRAELSTMADIGSKEGVIEEGELTIIKNLLRFNKILVRDIMTPSTVLIVAQEDTTVGQFYESIENITVSRIPIYGKNIDDISGFILKDDLLEEMVNRNEQKPLKSFKRDILVVEDKMPIPELFNKLMERREHIAIVINEYGGTAGVVAMEDVIETLLGMEIMDEMDNIDDLQNLARKQWQERAKGLGLMEGDEKKNDDEPPK